MKANGLSVEITQEKEDTVTRLLHNSFKAFPGTGAPLNRNRRRNRGSRKVNSRPGSRFSAVTRLLFPMRKVFISLVSGYLWRGVMIFLRMLCNLYGYDPKHLSKWCDAIGGMTDNLSGNNPEHLPEWCDAIGGMTGNLSGNNPEHLPEWCDAIGGLSDNLSGNNPEHLPEWCDAFGK